jgi:hypothetical protein
MSLRFWHRQERVPPRKRLETHGIAQKPSLFQGGNLKNYLITVLICMTAVFALPARSQTSATNLVMAAHWDDGTDIQGTVTLGQLNASAPDIVIATKSLPDGRASDSEPLGATIMYNDTLLTTVQDPFNQGNGVADVPSTAPTPTSGPMASPTATATGSPTPSPTSLLSAPPIVTGNILTNGDFSDGLHCFGDWGWYKDYQFALSTDYHSPPYAAEIRCTGGSCAKASILVTDLPITPGKSYLLQVYTKCKTGGKGDVFMAGKDSTGRLTSQIDSAITCNGEWNNSVVYFNPGPTAKNIEFEIFSRTAVPLLIDDVVLTYSDGTVPAQNPWAHPGIRNVSVSKSTVSVDGKPYLALGFSSVPPSAFAQVAALGANTLAAPSEIDSGCYATGGKGVLDQAYELGLNVLPDTTSAARAAYDNGTLSANGGGGILTLPDIVTRYGPHLANIGWFLDDEPDLDAYGWYPISPSDLISEHNAIRSKSSLPVLADFQQAHYDDHLPPLDAPYNGSADIWMAEPYGNSSNPGFTYVTHAINLLEGIHERPIWLFQNDITASLIVPKAYWAIVHGATGILYFNWPAFASTADVAKLKAAGQVFSELGSLKNVIFAPSVSVTAPTGVAAIARQYQGKTYIFAVNPTITPVTGSFSVAGLTSGKVVTVEFENRSITASSSGITDTFSGITRHVYIFQ